MVERRWLNYRKFVKYEKKWGKAWRICCMFLPMRPSNYVIFCNYVTRSLGSCVRSKELIRLAKIKNATERIYRRSLTRIYDLPVKISTALWHSFVLSHSPSSLSSLTPFFSSLFFFLRPLLLLRLLVFVSLVLCLFFFIFFFFINRTIISSNVPQRTFCFYVVPCSYYLRWLT